MKKKFIEDFRKILEEEEIYRKLKKSSKIEETPFLLSCLYFFAFLNKNKNIYLCYREDIENNKETLRIYNKGRIFRELRMNESITTYPLIPSDKLGHIQILK